MPASVEAFLAQPEVWLPCLAGVILITIGYTVASVSLPALGMTIGAVLGGAVAQFALVHLDPEVAKQYWWAPLVVALVLGLVAAAALTRLIKTLLVLAAFACGALLKKQLAGDMYLLEIGGYDVSPLVAGAVLALLLFWLHKPAIILLTSLLGASLIVRQLELGSEYLWVGMGAGLLIQWIMPGWRGRAGRREERQHAGME